MYPLLQCDSVRHGGWAGSRAAHAVAMEQCCDTPAAELELTPTMFILAASLMGSLKLTVAAMWITTVQLSTTAALSSAEIPRSGFSMSPTIGRTCSQRMVQNANNGNNL